MVIVKVKKVDGHIQSVSTMGHAGYAPSGEDIVCASVSSIVQTALLGLLQVAKINVSYSYEEDEGIVRFKIPSGITKEQQLATDIILETMLCGVSDLQEGYSDYINLEVK